MKIRNGVTATALTLLVAAAPAAMALNTKTPAKTTINNDAQLDQVFAQFDANRDGYVSRGEFPGDDRQFNLADANRDGRITRTEAQQIAQNREVLESEYRRLDTNRDGMISRSEWRGDASAFDRMDRNRDGVISQADRTGR